MMRRPKVNSAIDGFGWNAGPKEVSCRDVNEAMIGREAARARWIDSKSRERVLRQQSEDLVRRLEHAGVNGRTERDDLYIIGLISGQAEKLPNFRNCNMIPSQQARNVHDMMRHVQYLADTTRKGRLRMLVVSAGFAAYNEYRTHHKAHTRRMSKFAAHPKLKEWGIEIVYYNVENTIRRFDGLAMLNLHSHVLFKCRRKLGKEKWTSFLEFARAFFPKGYIHDSKIENPKEVVKYVFKPAEFDLLTDPELAELFQQITGGRPKVDPLSGEVEMRQDADGTWVEVCEGPLKFFHPLGAMRAFRAELRRHGQKLILVPTVDDRWIWRLTEPKQPEERPAATDSRPPKDRVMAITRPMPKFMTRMEPCLIVQGYRGHFDDLIRQNRLEDARADACTIYQRRIELEARQRATPIKDTTTTTVRDGGRVDITKPPYPPPDHLDA